MIYFDNNATTQTAGPVLAAMIPFLSEQYGNPSSAYSFSLEPREAIDKARENVAALVGAGDRTEIFFTSGGTESDNWAIRGALAADPRKDQIVTTAVEHEAIRNLCDLLEMNGVTVARLGVDGDGMIDLDELSSAVSEKTAVVSVMLANNETGVIFPVKEAAAIVKERSQALFHVDAVNAAGKIPINVSRTAVDLLSISAHKFHGPKGIGALYVRKGSAFSPQSIGGGQEMGMRAGTEAVHSIAGIGAAASLASDLSEMDRVKQLRERLDEGLSEKIPNCIFNGINSLRLPNTSNVSFPGANGEVIVAMLNDAGVCVSTGSACNEGLQKVSPVLKAMEVPFEIATSSIRFSLGRFNTAAEVDSVLELMPKIVYDLRGISGTGS
ncbi:MAG: aminotransferase class V-fold PLP-dependent enzyme [Acidobacteria bacterium]|nr:MAG: aminotransferase class V-fold PLP-dependent enzyme [Acidobacteriota bacterium]REK02922.1 MAG: aminotransferase class V-fold PLP-dependent enzyme [Acidobacteriota bacterium]REK13274.1 MAG: aminotransferase class V-fold PLP-dependent enzyme [Acidobacteriota bacterium]REK41268.1 MAG: aminotransferase class V-fold PLP-dependent enzyme [Acidobacteriota bacterium]